MKIIKCDRCGKEINYDQGRPAYMITHVSSSTIIDLCQECRKKLANFIKGGDEE